MARLGELEKMMEAPDFWNNQESAQKTVAELKTLKAMIDPVKKITAEVEDVGVLFELAEEEGDAATKTEVESKLDEIESRMDAVETQALLSGKHDHRNCFLSIYAGDGGTEANDWAEMMLRMYLHYFQSAGFKVEELDKHMGEEAGIKDVTLHVVGPYAYGYMICERGTHRLARVSPFNSQGKRQTSFATVDVVPELEDNDIEVDEKECDIEFFVRASGPGGQNVNKVATACRILHRPSGITVVCSNERKQMQNKKQALAILQAKLEQLEEERREAERHSEAGGKLEMGWGTQIRSYVFYDNRVKDMRTGYEVGNPMRVMDGDIQGFIDAELRRRQKAKQTEAAK
ncbi:MAG: peptide chain release factor 2 [Planctomycetes bacterium]|nr:peptide chain release factor 2 [Planctomycetota bacterium]